MSFRGLWAVVFFCFLRLEYRSMLLQSYWQFGEVLDLDSLEREVTRSGVSLSLLRCELLSGFKILLYGLLFSDARYSIGIKILLISLAWTRGTRMNLRFAYLSHLYILKQGSDLSRLKILLYLLVICGDY